MRFAASLVLVRGYPDDTQVFLVRRRDDASFLSGFYAFPGGFVEPEDGDPVDPEAVCRRAAVREAHEEVGLRGVEPKALIPAGRWTTPPYLVARFETRYYILHAEHLSPKVPAGHGELAAGRWICPAEVLGRFRRGEILLAPPTLQIVRALAAERLEMLDDQKPRSASWAPIRPEIALFPLRTPTLPPATHTNCYVAGTRRLAVFEPAAGDPAEQQRLDAWLDRRIAEGARVECVVLTHHHGDHVGGVAHLAGRLGVPVVAHRETAALVDFPVDRLVDQGDVLDLGDVVFDVHHTPGHAPGHLCFVDRRTGSAIVGDMVAGVGSILIEPGDGDMATYLASLARLRELGPSCLLPSHGPVIGGARAKLTEYIEHRLDRERQVVEALAQGPADLATLTQRVYTDVPDAVKSGPDGGIAGRSLAAHLAKLHAEGRAVADGAIWRSVSAPGSC